MGKAILMNIFVTSACPTQCAQALDDKRLVKMVLETAQLLSTALRFYGYAQQDVYRSTHVNHPCAVWARLSRANFDWLTRHMIALCAEYQRRFLRVHKSEALIVAFQRERILLPDLPQTAFPNCARNDSKNANFADEPNVHIAYQRYLVARWATDARTPLWSRQLRTDWSEVFKSFTV